MNERHVASLEAAVNRYAFSVETKDQRNVLDVLDNVAASVAELADETNERLESLEAEAEDFSRSLDRTDSTIEEVLARLATLEAGVEEMREREQEERIDP